MALTEAERDRRARHRLAVIRHAQEVTYNVAKTCRFYSITRTAYYKWLRRSVQPHGRAVRLLTA